MNELLQSIRHKNKLYKMYLRNPSDQNAHVYKNHCNLLTRFVKQYPSISMTNLYLINLMSIPQDNDVDRMKLLFVC